MTDRVVEHKMYLHGDKESNYGEFEELGGDIDGQAAVEFSYAGYEVCIHCMVDLDTGECEAYGIDPDDGKGLVEFSRPFSI